MARISLRDNALWSLPNYLLEPRHYYLGGDEDKLIATANKWRTAIGVLTLAGIAVAYPAFTQSLPGQITGLPAGTGAYNFFNYLANWLTNTILAVVLSAFFIVFFSLVLTLTARSGARLATLWQLRWPVVAIGLFVLWLLGLVGLTAVANPVADWVTSQNSVLIGIAAGLVGLFAVLLVMTWLIKALYLAAVNVFRADDGHPLLGLWVSTAVVWTVFLINALTGGDPQGVPHDIGLLMAWLGPGTVTVINAAAWWRLSHTYGTVLFRDGPLGVRR
ncbi:hypothetical protein [Kutzneria buriramensis]|uniref:Uncharacterized protein n=1 Tax=Kutzneria buriramensis TaxID=1045776 RepID=A0A3E0I604_9PSEU|nr:hypothetical protein [Kutzneria buriramensis]REH54067.1 hypothetical protein BCF44_102299 [Kutzneria buriramensis]